VSDNARVREAVPPGHRRLTSRVPPDAGILRIHHDPELVSSFLCDAAHVSGGAAAGVAFPASISETAALVARATRVLPVGAQSSLTGGATPRGDLVLSTRALGGIGDPGDGLVRVGAGVSIATLQARLGAVSLYYPPAPTFEGATIGGAVSTNAAGPATFKYGATRRWVEALTVVLASGELLDVVRGETTASAAGRFEIVSASGGVTVVQAPTYRMPDVPKLSAGYHAGGSPQDLIDLFIGSEGTLGVIVDATLRVIPRPRRAVALLVCRDEGEAIAVTTALRNEARAAWQGRGDLDVSAVEYIDAHASRVTPDEAFARAGVPRPSGASVLLIVQMEMTVGDDAAFRRLQEVLDAGGAAHEPLLALPGDERGAAALLGLREAVPAAVNARVAAAKASIHGDIDKTAGDMIVPFDRVAESLAVYREAFGRRRLEHAIWGHLSDGNLHPNVIPRSLDDVLRGREAILEIGRRITAMGGAPLAEHGVGRSAIKQQLLRELYGEEGIEQMRRVKRALDPEWKLAPGVLFTETS
jgi:D-lactate dehydrogenase (cytochrome)